MSQLERMFLLGLSLLLSGSASSAQKQAETQTPVTPAPATAVANQADVASPDAIIAATYNVISGPAGQKRDWDRMRSLFWPGARLIRTSPRKEGGVSATSFSTQEYIARASL